MVPFVVIHPGFLTKLNSASILLVTLLYFTTSSIDSLSLSPDADSVCLEPDSLSHSGGDDLAEGMQFSIWVSFYEIYNEFLYDLLDASPCLQPRKRVTLRLSDDKQGNPYVKGDAHK